MMKGIFLKLSVIGYTLFVLYYNIFVTSPLIINYCHVLEKLFMLMTLFMDYTNSSLTDKLAINYFRILTLGILIHLIFSVFSNSWGSYSPAFLSLIVVCSMFGSLIVLYLDIRRFKR